MNEHCYYNGYQLDEPACTYQLKEKEIQIIEIGQSIAENHLSIRAASREFLVPKSTIHHRIHNDLRILSYELYSLVCKQLNWNKKEYKQEMEVNCLLKTNC